MNKKIKKTITILVSLLFLTTIPSIVGLNSDSEDIEPCLDITRVFLRGFIIIPHRHPDKIFNFFAVRLFYIEFNPTERTKGWITLKWVTIKNPGYIYIEPKYEFGFGLFSLAYLVGFYEGGLVIGR